MDKIRLTRAKLAARLNKSISTVAHWAVEGKGPKYIVIHGRVVYDLEDVERWEAEHTHQSTAEYAPTPGSVAGCAAMQAKREAEAQAA